MGWTVHVLGSGQDGGLPQFGARLATDEAARSGRLPQRTSSSVAVVADDGRVLLVDVGPDLKAHEQRLLALTKVKDPIVDGIALTHAHMGHYAGLVHFGREAAAADGVPVFCTPSMAEFLSGNAPWSLAIADGHLALHPSTPPARVSVWPDLEIELIPVPHRHEFSDTVAVSIAGSVLYLPDIDAWEPWEGADETIARHDVALLDATFFSHDELPGRDIATIPHPLVPDTLERFEALARDRRLILTHLNHSNPLVDPQSVEAAMVRTAGFEVAYDGMVIEV